jgi:hypothetical protein
MKINGKLSRDPHALRYTIANQTMNRFTRVFRQQHGSVGLTRIYTGTLSSGEAIARCNDCRKYVNTAKSPDCRFDQSPLGKYHNLPEYEGPKCFQQQVQHRRTGPRYAVSLILREPVRVARAPD